MDTNLILMPSQRCYQGRGKICLYTIKAFDTQFLQTSLFCLEHLASKGRKGGKNKQKQTNKTTLKCSLFLLSKKKGGALGLLPNPGRMPLPFVPKTGDSNLGEASFDFPITQGTCPGAWLGGGGGARGCISPAVLFRPHRNLVR